MARLIDADALLKDSDKREGAYGLIFSAEDIRNAPTIKAEPKWISVKDRLPEPFVSVLVHMPMEEPCPTVHEGYISRDGVWMAGMFKRDPDEVTHWMPLPEPPKEEK